MATPESNETITTQHDAAPDDPAQSQATDGPDPADDPEGADVARDPDVIQREIEQTRAELAETIDAIADRVSPKRAASRGVAEVKSKVSAIKDKATSSDDSKSAAASVLDAGSASVDRPQLTSGGVSDYTGTSQYAVSRSLRTDRVLIVVGVAAAVTAIVVLRRSR